MLPEIASPVAPVPYWTYLIPVIIAAIGMVQVVVLAWINGHAKSAAINTEQTKGLVESTAASVTTTVANTKETKDLLESTAANVEKVHVAVNSERTAMLEKLEQLEHRIVALSEDKARLEMIKK